MVFSKPFGIRNTVFENHFQKSHYYQSYFWRENSKSITIKKLLYFAVKVDQFDVPRFNALCRGEELRVSNKIQDNKKVNNADLSNRTPNMWPN